MTPHPIYSQAATVFLVTAADKFGAMQHAMDESHFLDHLEEACAARGTSHEAFRIAIKPNIMTAALSQESSPVYTDPQLVEYMIAHMRARGFHQITVVEARNVYDYAYRGRSVHEVADMVGYTAHDYRIADLSVQPEPFEYGGVLGAHTVGRAWRDADYRISFAKNKTHWQCFYTGCMKNVYGCLPEWDKMKHYHGKRREFYECCVLILDAFPVHFGFVDAWVSGDGFSGHVHDANPNDTRTIMASANILALDWVMGEKMGLDPTKSSVMQEALRVWEKPAISRCGNCTPWKPWTNVRPCTVALLDALEEHYGFSRFFARAFASRQDPRFPPVSRWQWLFGLLQVASRLVERLLVTKT